MPTLVPMDDYRIPPTDFSSLLLRLYRLSQELPIQHFQDAALAQIKQVLPFDSSMWGTATTSVRGIDIHTVHLHQKSPEMLAAYEPVKHLDTAAAQVFGKRQTTLNVHAPSWFGGAEMGAMRDVLERFGQQNVFITADSNPRTNFVHWISLYRADPHAHGSEAERQLLDRLAPHLMQALALNRVMHLDHLEQADRAQSPHGAAIADARGVLYHADAQFSQCLHTEWDGWSGAHLPARLLVQLGDKEGRFVGRRIVVRQYVEHGLMFLKARARHPADQLTEREWTIARLIARGESHKQIAQALGRSPATVRNQIQGIYEKLGVGSIAQLIDALRQAE